MNVRAKNTTLNLRVVSNSEGAERFVAEHIAAQMRNKSNSVIGLATGNSMIGVYRQLIELYREGTVSFAGLTSFNLDEYYGLPANDPSNFASYMRRHLFDHFDADPTRLHLPDGNSPAAAADYEDLIVQSGGIDLQLLGIGRNGHIGFNEPGSPQSSITRLVELTAHTREVNAADFPKGAEVPAQAVTMGIATILASRQIILLANGTAKADAIAQALEGPIDPACPASFLQLHSDLIIVCDTTAAALLRKPTETRNG